MYYSATISKRISVITLRNIIISHFDANLRTVRHNENKVEYIFNFQGRHTLTMYSDNIDVVEMLNSDECINVAKDQPIRRNAMGLSINESEHAEAIINTILTIVGGVNYSTGKVALLDHVLYNYYKQK